MEELGLLDQRVSILEKELELEMGEEEDNNN